MLDIVWGKWNKCLVISSIQKKTQISLSLLWCGAGLNRRHKDFQSFALPTELPHLSSSEALAKEDCYLFRVLIFNFSTFKTESLKASSTFAEPAKIRVFMISPKAFRPYNKLKIR